MVRCTSRQIIHLQQHLSHSKYQCPKVDPKDLVWSILFTCEHASNVVRPTTPLNWGWGPNDIKNNLHAKHWGIDIGAFELTMDLLDALDQRNGAQAELLPRLPNKNTSGTLSAICAEYSRLLLDCNRPFGSDTMFRTECDGIPVDLNRNLTQADKEIRKEMLYDPFHNAISEIVQEEKPKMIFSVHSFNPTYNGEKREMEVGILFDDSSEHIGTQVI